MKGVRRERERLCGGEWGEAKGRGELMGIRIGLKKG